MFFFFFNFNLRPSTIKYHLFYILINSLSYGNSFDLATEIYRMAKKLNEALRYNKYGLNSHVAGYLDAIVDSFCLYVVKLEWILKNWSEFP